MQKRSKLVFAVAAMTLSGLADAQTTARSVVSDARFGAVYAGYACTSGKHATSDRIPLSAVLNGE
jgi:hypothetical protein